MPCSLLFVAAYLLPHAAWFTICCCYCHMLYSCDFVAACRTVCYLLPHAVQMLFVATICCLAACGMVAICCRMSCSLLFCCRTLYSLLCRMPCSLLFVAALCTVCYLLPHAIRYLLPHVVQFATYCLVPYSCWFLLHTLQLLFVAVSYTVAICCCMLYGCYFVAACHVVWFLLPIVVQLAMYCYMSYSYSLVFVAACCAVRYLLPYAMQLAICCCTLYS